MTYRLTFHEYKELQRTLPKKSQKQLSAWIQSIYNAGFQDGRLDVKIDNGNTIDYELLKIALRATEGVGDVLFHRLVDTIDRLCFEEEDNDVKG